MLFLVEENIGLTVYWFITGDVKLKTKKRLAPVVISVWKRQLPNMITGLRIAMVPAVVYCLLFDDAFMGLLGAIFFGVASISDWFDGYFARKYDVVSVLGKLLDPVADKLLVTAALVMFIPLNRISAILVILLISRDYLISGLRSVAASEQIVVAAGDVGKWKTAIQMFAIPAVMLKVDYFGIPWMKLGVWALWLSLILSMLSGAQYMLGFFGQYSKASRK